MPRDDFFFVLLFVDGRVKHGFYEDTTIRMSAKDMDTVRYGMVRDDGQTPEEAARTLAEAYECDVRERIRTARVGRMSADDFVEVRL